MARIALFSHAPSNTINDLKDAIQSALTGTGHTVVKVRRTGSTFRGRSGDLFVNYGSSGLDLSLAGNATLLNHPTNIGQASNKVNAFQVFQNASVKTVDWTTSRQTAETWVSQGEVVYCRTVLQGHSGEGIQICSSSDVTDIGGIPHSNVLPRAPLYTKAITAQRREFRVHVMNGVVTYVQQKRRRDNYREDGQYSNVVRNHSTGWIYATQNAEVNNEAISESLKAIAALGLYYGAVDVITRGNEAWVLEVNTAPGMTGTNLETYASNFVRILNGQSPEAPPVQAISDDSEPTPVPAPRTEPAPADDGVNVYRVYSRWSDFLTSEDLSAIMQDSTTSSDNISNRIRNHVDATLSQIASVMRTISSNRRATQGQTLAHFFESPEGQALKTSALTLEEFVSGIPRDLSDRRSLRAEINTTWNAVQQFRINQFTVFKHSESGIRIARGALSIEILTAAIRELVVTPPENGVGVWWSSIQSDRASAFSAFKTSQSGRSVETNASSLNTLQALYNQHTRTIPPTNGMAIWWEQIQSSRITGNAPNQQSIPVARPAPTAIPTAQSVSQQAQAAATQEARSSSPVPLVDGKFYWINYESQQVVGQYSDSMNHFLIPGWEIGVDLVSGMVIREVA